MDLRAFSAESASLINNSLTLIAKTEDGSLFVTPIPLIVVVAIPIGLPFPGL